MIPGIVCVVCELNSVLHVLVLSFELMLQFFINAKILNYLRFHGIFLFSELADFLPQLIVVGRELIELLIRSHQLVLVVLHFLFSVDDFGAHSQHFSILLKVVDGQLIILLLIYFLFNLLYLVV